MDDSRTYDIVDNTANQFPSFLREVNFYKKNYPSENDGESLASAADKYVLFNSKTTGSAYGFSSLLSLDIKESIFTPYMSGTLELFDEYNLIETVNFTGNETVEIVFNLHDEEEPVSIRFRVISAKAVSDLTTSTRINFIEPTRIYHLEFISEEIFNNTFTNALLKDEKDFIGFIAKSQDDEGEIKGLVNEIAKQLQLDPIEIEETKNGVWLKRNEISYPTGKDQGQFLFANLMQHICTYAVAKENPNAVNFFFWRDRYGWKFKSIENLINAGFAKAELSDSVNEATSNSGFTPSFLIQKYILETADENNPYRVWKALAVQQLDSMKLFSQKAYSAYYRATKPNFYDPYSNFLDTTIGFTGTIVDYDYHRDFDKVQHIEQFKLISEDTPTSPFISKNLPIPAFRQGDDSVYGYYDTMRYNTPYGQWIYNSSDMAFGKKVEDPAVVWWDYLGRSGDSRWSNSVWQPQFDMTDLDVKTLHSINKNIREPLRKKREEFAHKKNIKRKWEVYRCAVCCLEGGNAGGTADYELINQFQGLTGATFNILFGATGLFTDLEQEYKVVAAGSFTDLINYDSGDTGSQNGLTYSYDLTKAPYNQSIGQFYNIKENPENYIKYVFDRGLHIYDTAIQTLETRLNELDNFIGSADGYIAAADNWITTHLYPCPEGKSPNNKAYPGFGGINNGDRDITTGVNISCGNNADYSFFYTEYPNGGKIPNLTIPEGLCWKSVQFSCPNQPNYESLPEFVKTCSKDSVVGPIEVLNNYATFVNGYYQRYYNLYSDYYDWIYPWQRRSYYESNHNEGEIERCIDNGDCYNTVCFNPIALEIQKRVAVNERKALFTQIELLKYTRQLVETQLYQKWISQYQEWYNREAFFFSKKPGTSIFTGVTGGRTGPVTQPLSLYNIKSVTRKEIRGSRYEILAKSKGLTGSKIGEWAYNIFFGNDENVEPIEKHPYYDQGYSDKNGKGSFITQRNAHYAYTYEDANTTNNPPWTSQYAEDMIDPAEFTEKIFVSYPNNVVDGRPGFTNRGIIAGDLKTLEGYTDEGFRETFNIFDDDLTEKKPPNIKKEEISSYVRIEFSNAIGLDRIADFPNAFVRDAGIEYFLPYLVQLTPGPNGRQAIRNNIAVIGMDPYGFDVAIKKSKVDPDEKLSRDYWWWGNNRSSTGLSENAMDLWPEFGFETARPYYTADPRNYWNTADYYGSYRYENWWDSSDNTNYYNAAATDPEYRLTSHGSQYLYTSHKKIKPHRSWWSFHFPKNVFIPQRFFGAFQENYGGWYAGFYSGSTFIYGYWNYYFWYGDEVERWLRLADTPDTAQLLSQAGFSPNEVILPKTGDGFVESMNVYTETSIEDIHPDLKRYFTQTTLHWLNADYTLYRPGLLSDELWKYDLSGETEYGLITPPTTEPNYDLFDNNFAAQFVVYGRSSNLCKQFTCANPNGKVSNRDCPESNPYCNCPAQEHMPMEKEPTYLELYQLYNELRECKLVEEYLGEDYLGCIWIDPNNPCSCNCPEIGEKFGEYLEYTKTYATFWDTPKNTPLVRNALISQFMSQQVTISIVPNRNIKVGDIIKINHKSILKPEEIEDEYIESKRFDGYWMVSEIRHRFDKESIQYMQLTLNRDTLPREPNR